MPSSSDLGESGSTNASLPLDLYKAPYEKRASTTNLSVVDNLTTELNNLGVSDVRQRRDTFPVRSLAYPIISQLHTPSFSLSINLLGPHQRRGSNTNLSMDVGTMNRIKDPSSLSFRTINQLTRTHSRPYNRPISNTSNQKDHDTAFPAPRVHQVL